VPRKVALIVGNYVNVVDGVALTYGRVVRERLLAGDELMVFAPGPGSGCRPPIEAAGASVVLPSMAIPVQPEYRLALGIPRAQRRRLEAFEPELIHVASPDLAGVAALDFAAAHGLPTVAAYHSEIARYLRYLPLWSRLPAPLAAGGALLEGVVWAWIRRFYNRCGQVLVPTEATRTDLRRRGVVRPTALWGRGVDLERFSPRWRSPQWRAGVGATGAHAPPVILFAARLRWEKGLDVLCAVLRGLEARGVPHTAVIVGEGPAAGELRRELPRAHFLGALDVGALAQAYASADLFLYPSPTETFGNVTLEAMASGLTPLCADLLGSRSLVRDGETGTLVPAGDVSAFIEAAAALLADAPRRARLGRSAREYAAEHSWAVASARLARLWTEALGQD